MPFLEGAGGQVHYRVWPVSSPRMVLVFLHGIRQSSGDYHRFGRALGRWEIEVWAIDHTGHGLSEGQENVAAPLGELAENARRLVDTARRKHPDSVPLALMGHSLGAATALAACAEPTPGVAGLVLCGTPKGVTSAAVTAPNVPVFVIHGVDDRLAPIDAVRAWVTDNRHVVLREYVDAGHDLLHEPVHATVTADVAEWLLGLAADDVGALRDR